MAIVAAAGLVVACAPASQTPATPGALGALQGTSTANSGTMKTGKTVAEIYAGKDSLAGTVVNVRGKVVKFSSQIMGKNWAHVQDGTGSAGTNDLTVTTQDAAKVGDTVLVSGTITLNKDFGAGYFYALIIEEAKLTVAP